MHELQSIRRTAHFGSAFSWQHFSQKLNSLSEDFSIKIEFDSLNKFYLLWAINHILRQFIFFFHVTNQPETKRCASAASLGQTLCFPKDPPAIGLTLFSSTNLSCSSHVIVLRQHGTARAPNPYEKQHPLGFNTIPIEIKIQWLSSY